MKRVILLTGAPGSGKTTVIRRVLAELSRPAGGFYTRELREDGVRRGFEMVTLDGECGILAHLDIHSPKRVSKYGVDTTALDGLAVPAIQAAVLQDKVVVIDEIGPMEILSPLFRRSVMEALQSEVSVLGTIVQRRTPYTERIKSQFHANLIEVTLKNREELPEIVLRLLEGD